MGGENTWRLLTTQLSVGSSPHGRGKRGFLVFGRSVTRLIPAWAGKTLCVRRRLAGSPAHPRAGGENYKLNSSRTAGSGSSPRGRGKLALLLGRPRPMRLIPARAGKTTSSRSTKAHPRAHPRVGGENSLNDRRNSRPLGSSPRGRGKRVVVPLLGLLGRLIPAWAGKTDNRGGRLSGFQAHPRAGGENRAILWAASLLAGSSPRGRGKRGFVDTNRHVEGLIPARAGKT